MTGSTGTNGELRKMCTRSLPQCSDPSAHPCPALRPLYLEHRTTAAAICLLNMIFEGNDCIGSQSKANVKNKPLGFEGAGETNTIWGMFAHVQERAVVLNEQMKHLRPIGMSM